MPFYTENILGHENEGKISRFRCHRTTNYCKYCSVFSKLTFLCFNVCSIALSIIRNAYINIKGEPLLCKKNSFTNWLDSSSFGKLKRNVKIVKRLEKWENTNTRFIFLEKSIYWRLALFCQLMSLQFFDFPSLHFAFFILLKLSLLLAMCFCLNTQPDALVLQTQLKRIILALTHIFCV